MTRGRLRAALSKRRVAITSLSLCAVAAAIGLARLHALDYDLTFMLPDRVFDVDVVQTVEGHGERIRLRTFLPLTDERQRVVSETSSADQFELQVALDGGNRVARWTAESVSGKRVVSYRYRVAGEAVRFDISDAFRLPAPPSGERPPLTSPTKVIQVDAPEVQELAESLVPADGSLAGFLRAAFDHVDRFGFKPFKGTTDALTALRLGEASCNGRGRLLVALLRARGVAARLVGGVVLTQGAKRTSHQWVEARVAGHFVPFDPTNHHFASLPAHYLALYRGDHVLFGHTSDVAFDYQFRVHRRLVPRQELAQHQQVLGLWSVFAELGIPLDLLKLIIMIPLGAMVVVIFRNVVGLRTFGTFLPALIAAASSHTGFAWGAVGFVALILVVSLVRRLLARLELLHSPQLAVMLTTVISSMLLVTLLCVRYGLSDLARISLFPVAIMAITSERFVLMEQEEGPRVAWATMGRTLLVMFFCYVTMNSLALQILMLGFPELLLVVIAMDVWLGRWMGLRLSEWSRFRPIFGQDATSP